MSERDKMFWFLCWLIALVLGPGVGMMVAERDTHREFRECRQRLATLDSATVVTVDLRCAKWTLPPREAR